MRDIKVLMMPFVALGRFLALRLLSDGPHLFAMPGIQLNVGST